MPKRVRCFSVVLAISGAPRLGLDVETIVPIHGEPGPWPSSHA